MYEGNIMSDTSTEKRTVNRSSAYPGSSLDQVVEAARTLRTNLGNGPYSRESAAKALGYSGVTGTSSTKIAACAHFGILVREGNAYKQSELANEIFNPQSEEERKVAIKSAFRIPTLYAKLISAYEGKALPVMLDNILVRQYGIQERASAEAAAIFKKSAEFAGVLSNGVLITDNSTDTETEPTSAVEGKNTNDGKQNDPLREDKPAPKYDSQLPVPIGKTGIVVVFPVEYAYSLSIGTFTTGIKELAKNAEGMVAENEQSTDSTQE